VLVILFPILGWANGYYSNCDSDRHLRCLALGLTSSSVSSVTQSRFCRFLRHWRLSLGDLRLASANAFIQATCSAAPTGFCLLVLSIIVGALTGFVLGLPVLRLPRRLSRHRHLGFAEVRARADEQSRQAGEFTNGPRGSRRSASGRYSFSQCWNFFGLQVLKPSFIRSTFISDFCSWSAIILVTRQLEKLARRRAWKAIREDEIAAAAMAFRWCA